MSTLDSLFMVTEELLDLLSLPIEKEKREEAIERINSLLDSRDNLIADIKPPYTEKEKQLGAEIVRMNKIIDAKLAEIKLEIQTDLALVKKGKTISKKYTNPYQVGPADGMFFDKRK
ncbi:flagellar protein FliT [Bacillus sp. HNG]|uniref:flagellar protein FliT n=1 Tax=Bacillus sp. HNG TaxID=2293325 RepID=UPI000E2F30FE|nr:flagellar protein FliT [Bacillus sp. HNG]RFB09489.1 flagellar protein FliT [Bacillus sp. HNG]